MVIPLGAPFVTPTQGVAYSDAMHAILGLEASDSCVGNVVALVLAPQMCATTGMTECPKASPLTLDQATPTQRCPTAIRTDPSGHRLVVVAAGTSSASAGLTIIETTAAMVPVGSTGNYPADPNDFVMQADGFVEHVRYQPSGLALIYGH
jgi:hypothetical protein